MIQLWRMIKGIFVNDAHEIISKRGKEILAEEYNPYCPICSACGEDGCCSATSCKQHPDGDYCETYLKDLHFSYLMYKDLMNMLDGDEKYDKQIDEIYNENYDIIYKKK